MASSHQQRGLPEVTDARALHPTEGPRAGSRDKSKNRKCGDGNRPPCSLHSFWGLLRIEEAKRNPVGQQHQPRKKVGVHSHAAQNNVSDAVPAGMRLHEFQKI